MKVLQLTKLEVSSMSEREMGSFAGGFNMEKLSLAASVSGGTVTGSVTLSHSEMDGPFEGEKED
ncbi:hypothetical protein [Chitinophaga nivalis]|uniref:Bacteriocin n=1 Tax=Chitinophaga nivalis TaxID=2991709 RepID=A0ABT3IKN3_9BACT|nr:hypothetical protein [Chitinophaga nivalis]MCW3465791.1 hypothetical protein [Chitinophaga nivalis]MCW3484518.1 hypothetical protein [Chitinophaga nivalis]